MMNLGNGCGFLVLLIFLSLGHSEYCINYDCVPGLRHVPGVDFPNINFADLNVTKLNGETSDHPEFLSVFQFPRTPVATADCRDDPVNWIALQTPVVLKRCQFFNQALKWNLTYLAKALIDEYGVSISNSRKFLYYDSLVDYQNYVKAGWKPSYQIQYKNLEEFLEIASELISVNNGTHAYLQTLIHHDDRNTSVKYDLDNFDYTWLLNVAFKLGWSTSVLNMLFVGMPNVVSPLHHDIMENIFIQLQGKKRFILFSPDHFNNLYPYPVGHPHDRQSQVDLDKPDYERFPKFRRVLAFEAIVEPGDVLYVPTNWWHHVESSKNNFTVSLNFWFEDDITQRMFSKIRESASSNVLSPLTPAEDMALKRHVESIVYNMTRSTAKVKEIFQDLLDGRFGE